MVEFDHVLLKQKEKGPINKKVVPKFSKFLAYSKNPLCKLKSFCAFPFLKELTASNGNT